MKACRNYDFVYDGCRRARDAAIETIRAEVEREFADRLAVADWFKQLLLRAEMEREVQLRLDRVAPRRGLYFSA